jgi:MHS family proline/betaine transporter-like MFS transporter
MDSKATDKEQSKILRRRAIIACFAGNLFELYDFVVFGFFAIQIGRAVFPSHDPVTSLLASFATYGTGFLTRPIGAVVLGSYGDRRGRKTALSLTITLMAIATGLTGLVPTYARVGIWSPILLVLFRLLQGFSTGGEWGGATTFMVEYAPAGRRGFFGSLQQTSTAAAQLMAIGSALALNSWMPQNALDSWGWRLPFLLGFVMAPLGYYLRARVAETPSFTRTEAAHGLAASPLRLVLREYRPQLFTCFGITTMWTVASYVFITFMAAYASQTLHLSASVALEAVSIAVLANLFLIPVSGILSDKIGPAPIFLVATAGYLIVSVPFFLYIASARTFTSVALVSLVAGALYGLMNGAAPSMLSALFPTNVRYTALSVGYNSGVMIFGGFAPFISTWLVKATGSAAGPGFYPTVCAAISLTALFAARKTLFKHPAPQPT